MRPDIWGLVLYALVGAFIGVGSFTFHYGEGASYFSTDPEACVNCHIMQPQFDGWIMSSHRAVADCVDCHLPDDFPRDWVAKAENGWNHSWAFTFQDFHEPIRITPKNARILEANCLRCHAELVEQMAGGIEEAAAARDVSCMPCHSGVGHTAPPR